MSIDADGSILGMIPINPKLNMLLPPSERLEYTRMVEDFLNVKGRNTVPDERSPMSLYNYMMDKNELRVHSAHQRPMMRIADRNMEPMFELVNEVSTTYEELVADTGQARLVVVYDNSTADYMLNRVRIEEDLHLLIDPDPHNRTWRTRWGGKIHQINVARNSDGTKTIEFVALSNREHAKNLLFAANPFAPPEIQLPKMWVLPGPMRSIFYATGFVNLARLFVPGLSGVANAFNPLAWLNPLNLSAVKGFNPMEWPIQVAFVNPIKDQSRWTVLGSTWNDWHSATTDMLKDTGNVLRSYTWLTEDVDSPYEELVEVLENDEQTMISFAKSIGLKHVSEYLKEVGDRISDELTRPKRNCVIFRVEDLSGQGGPTGTAIDGLLNAIGVTIDDLFTSVIVDADTGQTLDGQPLIDVIQPDTPIVEGLLGVAPEPPKVIWRESQFDCVEEKKHTLYKSAPKTLMTGGRSPTILNQTQDALIQYGLSKMSDLINPAIGSASLGAVNTAYQTPLSNGIGFMYQGQLDNTFFAWERLTWPSRALFGGDLSYQEYLDHSSQTAYTLAAVVSLRQAEFKTRPYYGFTGDVLSGFPWVLDVDVRLGERAGWEFDGVIYVDQITAIRRQWSRSEHVKVSVSVGDDKDRQDPIARGIAAMQSVYSIVSAVMGQGTLFG